jgi:PAS domain S-box-containing protein
MDLESRPRVNRNVLFFVSAVAVFFLVAGGVLGILSAREMRETVSDQFNQQQLAVARHISNLIERQMSFLRREILFLRDQEAFHFFQPDGMQGIVQHTFQRVLESGVWRIEVLDPSARKSYSFTPFQRLSVKDLDENRLRGIPDPGDLVGEAVWISDTDAKPHGIGVVLAVLLPGKSQRLLLFDVNVSWFLAPFLSEVRSGKTGYAWVLDEAGRFLYHPNSEFVGRNAFTVREEKFPVHDYAQIDFIQKEKMLEGETGTGFFYSGWHRGITGNIRKLIAYTPVEVSGSPVRRWSVAVVAPTSEIETSVHRSYLRLFFLQGLVIMVIFVSAASVLFFEKKWSRMLERRVEERTEDLKKSEEKYRSLVESAEDFIFTVDSEGVLQSMNSFTASFFGGRPEQFIGNTLSALFGEDIARKQTDAVKQVYLVGKSVRDELEVEIGDHKIWLNANFMPLKDEEGTVTAVLCIARDTTENKNLERQLINTEKLASMGTLAAGVAHEVNNPLGVILGFCDLLIRKTGKDTQAYEDLKTIERQGLHCKQVVENLLSFARLGEGDSDRADLNECVRDIIKVVKHTLEMHDIDLALSLSDDLPPVKGDARQLQQVFLNLINNATSAMPTGGALRIRTSFERPTRRGVIQFQDDGVGIREEHKDRIFEPFFTTKPEGEGTGLGLFVSYGIITKYGGTIDFVSHRSGLKPGGTTFTIKLPTEG